MITKKIGKNFSKMKIETDLKIIIDMFSRLFFAYKRYQKGISKHKKSPEPLIYNDSELSWIIQTQPFRICFSCKMLINSVFLFILILRSPLYFLCFSEK